MNKSGKFTDEGILIHSGKDYMLISFNIYGLERTQAKEY